MGRQLLQDRKILLPVLTEQDAESRSKWVPCEFVASALDGTIKVHLSN